LLISVYPRFPCRAERFPIGGADPNDFDFIADTAEIEAPRFMCRSLTHPLVEEHYAADGQSSVDRQPAAA
jgi:hypothetical protein